MATLSSMSRVGRPRRSLRPRPLTGVERSWAVAVFRDRAEFLADVRILGIHGANGRAFTLPGPRRRTYIGLGGQEPVALWSTSRSYPAPGQLLVHELVHAWQRRQLGTWRYLLRGIATQVRHSRGADVYSATDPTVRWEQLNLEQQATVIDRWFGGQSSPTRRPRDPDSPFRHYLDMLRA